MKLSIVRKVKYASSPTHAVRSRTALNSESQRMTRPRRAFRTSVTPIVTLRRGWLQMNFHDFQIADRRALAAGGEELPVPGRAQEEGVVRGVHARAHRR